MSIESLVHQKNCLAGNSDTLEVGDPFLVGRQKIIIFKNAEKKKGK